VTVPLEGGDFFAEEEGSGFGSFLAPPPKLNRAARPLGFLGASSSSSSRACVCVCVRACVCMRLCVYVCLCVYVHASVCV